MENKYTALDTADQIDRLGSLLATIAQMNTEAKMLKDSLQDAIDAGDADEGLLFRAAHAVSERNTVDWKAVAAKLEPSRQLVKAHTKTSTVHTVRVSARKA